MNELKIFQSAEFGNVRTVSVNGEPWFIGKDVTDILGYSNSRKAIGDHVDDEDKWTAKCDTIGGIQGLTAINESGLYSLIFSSKLPSAKRFKRWVTSEVLPAIRKDVFVSAFAGFKDMIRPDWTVKDTTGWKSVYVMLFNDKSVKIGISQNVRARANTLQSSSGKQVEDYLYSPMCSNPEEVEKLLHSEFRDKKIKGEWFAVDFGEAKSCLMEVFGENALFEEHDFSKQNAFIDFMKHEFIGAPRVI